MICGAMVRQLVLKLQPTGNEDGPVMRGKNDDDDDDDGRRNND